MNLSVRSGWLKKSPFLKGDSLISLADEPHRTRILSFDEESRLFHAIGSNQHRFNLKGIVLIALDCAFRKNKILIILACLLFSTLDSHRILNTGNYYLFGISKSDAEIFV